MGEEETIFSSKISYEGVFSFKNFYEFCYEWLSDEGGLDVSESEYSEKITGDVKEIKVEWKFEKKITDYFKFKGKVKFRILNLKNVEIVQDGLKIKTNTGKVDATIKGVLERDYEGKFERSAFKKFWRGVYEKWIIPSTIKNYEDKLINICDNFLQQAKAYLDLEGMK